MIALVFNRAIPREGFAACMDFHYFDECVRLFFKPWSWGYWFHKWGVYGYGFATLGIMFWSAKEKRWRPAVDVQPEGEKP